MRYLQLDYLLALALAASAVTSIVILIKRAAEKDNDLGTL